MMSIEVIKSMTGYKATDANMRCRDVQFELGVWVELAGDIVECERGFHFCEQPSGVWAYYNAPGTRVFKVEAEDVLAKQFEPGADFKRVCRKIRLVEEVMIGGDRNTGDGNTGDRNTGDGNAGDGNAGDRNTGYRNTGDGNTGYRNTGDGNTGDRNTGDRNTGYRNTGDGNTGDRNTGDGNATNRSSGFFCTEEPTVICFDVDSGLRFYDFREKFGDLSDELISDIFDDSEIDTEKYSVLPGFTSEKLDVLIKKLKQEK